MALLYTLSIKDNSYSMKKEFYFLLLCLFSFNIIAQDSGTKNKIEWMSFEDAVKKNETEPKKFLIDVWTTWCGWCKKMDATTFTDPVIVEIVNKYYHPVKLNAERKDTVFIGEQMFVNEYKDQRRGTHQLAISLLYGKLTYPSIVYLDENVNMLQPLAGYKDPKGIEPILKYFGENKYKEVDWAKYQEEFKSSF